MSKKIDTQVFKSKLSIKLLRLRPKLSSTYFFTKKREMLDTYIVINFWKPTTILIRKILRKTLTSSSFYNALKILKAPKRFKNKEKTRNVKRELIKIIALIAQNRFILATLTNTIKTLLKNSSNQFKKKD